ncbi:helix-turn-helix domain-containing protein [Pelobacter propionicus]|uniref:Plasmid maintenance system antidote protein, XRE family n=1 Tax=Pelobacter propionicus (strain DSM 2379 / NBRC 103807 / OttBd1) TaxID=338966 RepID=A1AN18_PELPD|nr:helix-turn-helix transcriptional regulator [Pelobacter propionicus]ABK98738.1 plasmid maintenance system antidote protein, XRE family [Pelobacter propionicus DSM 2379]
MLARTKKRPTDSRVPLTLMVHPVNVERIKRYVASIEPEKGDEGSITLDEFFVKTFPGETKPAVVLRGSRGRENLTQKQLAEATGIPQRHISEMEHGKREIGKERAKKLAAALHCDYRLFL